MFSSTVQIRIYYEDTDFSGLVYHANYLKFFERGRTEGLREAGFNHSTLKDRDDPVVFAVRSMDISFHNAAHMDDILTITTTVAEVKGAKMVFHQAARRGDIQIASATVLVACLQPNGRPRRIPEDILKVLGPDNS